MPGIKDRFLDAFACGGDYDWLVVNGSPSGTSPSLLRALAKRCGKVAAVDSGAELALRAGIPIDAAIGDMDSISPSALADLPEIAEVVKADPVKDDTDLELALAHVGAPARRIAVANFHGCRLDHELASIGAMARCEPVKLAVCDECALAFLHEGRALALSGLGLAPGDEYSVVSLEAPAAATQSGVAYPQERSPIPPMSGLGVSNVVYSEDAQVCIDSGVAVLVVSF